MQQSNSIRLNEWLSSSQESQSKLTMATAMLALATVLLHTNLVVPAIQAAPTSEGGSDVNISPEEAIHMLPIDLSSRAVKRAAAKYSFGLGKRADEMESNYEFSPLGDDSGDMSRYAYAYPVNEKREPSQRYAFGLGKKNSDAANGEQVLADVFDADFDEKEKRARSKNYQFGLGKRTWFNRFAQDGKKKKVANFDEFMKRRYSFGLGKRSV